MFTLSYLIRYVSNYIYKIGIWFMLLKIIASLHPDFDPLALEIVGMVFVSLIVSFELKRIPD